MNEENTKRLYAKYPQLFIQSNLSLTQSPMSFGFEHEDGWYNIIDKLCADIMEHVNTAEIPVPQFAQVKEKFGCLRIYMDYSDETVDAMVDLAEDQSKTVCEVCGNSGKLTVKNRWAIVRCDGCLTT